MAVSRLRHNRRMASLHRHRPIGCQPSRFEIARKHPDGRAARSRPRFRASCAPSGLHGTRVLPVWYRCATLVGSPSVSERLMSTTTIRLPDDLKVRVARAAERAGTTSHNFILEAVSEKAARAEHFADFDAVAEARYAHIVESGKTISWHDMRKYLERRITDTPARRPAARNLAK